MTQTTTFASHLTVPLGSLDYPDGPIADALEAQIERTLPPLAGIASAECQSDRLAVYAQAIKVQMSEFVAMHGDPFGRVRPLQVARKAENQTLVHDLR